MADPVMSSNPSDDSRFALRRLSQRLPLPLFTLVIVMTSGHGAQGESASNSLEHNSPSPADRLKSMTMEELLAASREAVRGLGTYRARLVKSERINGKVLPAQTIDVLVRPAPRAVRLEYVAGPKSGRKVIWREDVRPQEILVREGGMLGLMSAWVDASGRLSRRDTNHAVSEIGFAKLLDFIQRDLAKGKASGGHLRKDLGVDASGLYRIEWTAPANAQGLYARRNRFGIDLHLMIPVEIEVFDAKGFLEKYEYRNVRGHQSWRPADFEEL